MYVTPKPDPADDPLYGVRLGLTGALSFVAVAILDPMLPALVAALPVGLIAGQRKAFNPAKAIAGPLVMIVLAWLMTWFVEWLHPLPLVFIGAMWLIYFAGFRMILRTGAPVGMLLVIIGLVFSVMGMHGNATVEALRDSFVQASLVALVIAPVVYFVVPPQTREAHVDNPEPGRGNATVGAAIRASVLLALSFWLYAVMNPSEITMALIAAMVLVFPTRRAVFFEARQRVRATLYGGAVTVGILTLFALAPHVPILLGLIFLGGLWLGQKMLTGSQPGMVYQYAFSVALALVAGALDTQDPGYAILTRVVLTLTGAFAAAFAVALLDVLIDWRGSGKEPESAAPTPAV